MKLRPLGDRIVVERLASKEQSPGGIFLPESYQQSEKPQLGLVLACGPGRRNDGGKRQPMDVKVGDLVLFSKFSGHAQRIDGDAEVLVFSEADVLCIVERDAPETV